MKREKSMNLKCSKSHFSVLLMKKDTFFFCSEHAFRGRHMEECIARDSLGNRWQNSSRTAVSWVLRMASLTNSLFHKLCSEHQSPHMGNLPRHRALLSRKDNLVFSLQGTTLLITTKYHTRYIQIRRGWDTAC